MATTVATAQAGWKHYNGDIACDFLFSGRAALRDCPGTSGVLSWPVRSDRDSPEPRASLPSRRVPVSIQLPDPTLAQMEAMRGNLAGVPRIFLSVGELLMRRDFGDILDMCSEGGHLLGTPANATRGLQYARHMAGKAACWPAL
jgi:hypothetical protein